MGRVHARIPVYIFQTPTTNPAHYIYTRVYLPIGSLCSKGKPNHYSPRVLRSIVNRKHISRTYISLPTFIRMYIYIYMSCVLYLGT